MLLCYIGVLSAIVYSCQAQTGPGPWRGPGKPNFIVLGWWNYTDEAFQPPYPVFQGEPNYDFNEYKPRRSDIRLQSSFQASDFMGSWYELFHTKNYPYSPNYATEIGTYYVMNPDKTIGVANRIWRADEGSWRVDYGLARQVESARWAVQFLPWAPPDDFRILYTDYMTTAAIYSEIEYHGVVKRYGAILSRRTNLDGEVLNQTFALFAERVNMSRQEFVRTRHGIAPKMSLTQAPTMTAFPATTPTTPKPVAGQTDPKLLKCAYVVPLMDRCYLLGPYVVYDSFEELCVTKMFGCRQDAIRQFAFDSFDECQRTCHRNRTTISTTPTTTPFWRSTTTRYMVRSFG